MRHHSSQSVKRVTIELPTDLVERLRNAVYWSPRLTVAGFIRTAISHQLCKLENDHGGRYPARVKALTGGRPKKRL